jgi:hypothetical protein
LGTASAGLSGCPVDACRVCKLRFDAKKHHAHGGATVAASPGTAGTTVPARTSRGTVPSIALATGALPRLATKASHPSTSAVSAVSAACRFHGGADEFYGSVRRRQGHATATTATAFATAATATAGAATTAAAAVLVAAVGPATAVSAATAAAATTTGKTSLPVTARRRHDLSRLRAEQQA